MAASATTARERVRALNDRLRQHGIGGTTLVTPGVRALGPDAISAILAAVTSFSAFDADNDPYGEHDFGSVQVQGRRGDLQDRLLQPELERALARPRRPDRDHARPHHYAGRGAWTPSLGNARCQASSLRRRTRLLASHGMVLGGEIRLRWRRGRWAAGRCEPP